MTKNLSVKPKTRNTISIHALFLIVWAVVSIIFYGLLCLLVRIFSEKAANKIGYWWLLHVYYFSGCKIELKNLEKLDKQGQYIFLANHQSVFDILALYLFLPYRLSFIAKKSLFYIPIFGWCIGVLGHIAIDRSNPHKAKKSIDKARGFIWKKKRSIFAFPEGTRSLTGELSEFKLGIFGLALNTGIDIVPVTINGSREVIPKNSYFISPGNVEIILHQPIHISEYKKTMKLELAQKTREIILSDLKQ